MKTCSKCGVEKELGEFYARAESPDGRRTDCKQCNNSRKKGWNKAHPEKAYAHARKWVKANPDRCAAYHTKYRTAHLPYYAALMAAWYSRHPGARSASVSKWAKKYPARHNAQGARYKALKLQATPCWVDHTRIQDLYDLAQVRTKRLGHQWQVDHVVPLKNPLVCGLHCEQNLQVIPASKNAAKGNRWWPDMPLEIRA
jgi:5-methylcytosine-specific restriction endonuclease McrA